MFEKIRIGFWTILGRFLYRIGYLKDYFVRVELARALLFSR